MSDDDAAFIRTIQDNPRDLLPRLVYADWLSDRDDPRGDLFGLTTLTGFSTSQLISSLVAVSAVVFVIIRFGKRKFLATRDNAT